MNLRLPPLLLQTSEGAAADNESRHLLLGSLLVEDLDVRSGERGVVPTLNL